jgi:hypothetical protein
VNGDGRIAEKVSLGNSGITPSGDNPVTVRIDHTKTIAIGWDKGNTAELWLTTSLGGYDIYLPWIEIRSPSLVLTGDQWKNDNNLQKIRMEWDNSKSRYRILYNGFTESGKYEIFYYVPSKTGKVYSGGRSVVYKNKKDNSPPNPFHLRLPDNGSEQKTVLVLKWYGTTDPDLDPVSRIPDPVSYNLVIAEDVDFRKEVYRQEELTVPMTFIDGSVSLADGYRGLYDGKTYYWKIEAVDCYGNLTASEVWSFTTKNTNVPPGIITGIVYSDRAMAFINQATVKAMIGTQVVASTTSEQNGFFALEVNAGAVDQLVIEKSGFETASINNVSVTSDESARVNPNITPMSLTKGDINGDNQVNLADAIIALQMISRMNPSGIRSDYATSDVDVNGDGKIGGQRAPVENRVCRSVLLENGKSMHRFRTGPASRERDGFGISTNATGNRPPARSHRYILASIVRIGAFIRRGVRRRIARVYRVESDVSSRGRVGIGRLNQEGALQCPRLFPVDLRSGSEREARNQQRNRQRASNKPLNLSHFSYLHHAVAISRATSSSTSDGTPARSHLSFPWQSRLPGNPAFDAAHSSRVIGG